MVSWDGCLIVRGLFLGNATAAITKSSRDKMKSLGIRAIVNVTEGSRIGVGNEFPDDFEYLHVDVADSPDTDLAAHFETVSSFIDRHRGIAGVVTTDSYASSSHSPLSALAPSPEAQNA